MPKRTFHNWTDAVENLFNITIVCEGFRYSIEKPERLRGNTLHSWLLNSLSVGNMLAECGKVQDRILLENVPSGREYLQDIIDAMKFGTPIEIAYQGFWSDGVGCYVVEPYCIKMFKQRWYVLARRRDKDALRTYALDRIHSLRHLPKESTFALPDGFLPELYFHNCYGIINDETVPVSQVKLKVEAYQANFLRVLPLHHSQQEVVHNDHYSVFVVTVRPTFDFQQEILSHSPDWEVLSPAWLRETISDAIKQMNQCYTQQI